MGKEPLNEFDKKGVPLPIKKIGPNPLTYIPRTGAPEGLSSRLLFLHDPESKMLYVEVGDISRMLNNVFLNCRSLSEAYTYVSEFFRNVLKSKEDFEGKPDGA